MAADGTGTWGMTLFYGVLWSLATALCAGIIAFVLGSVLSITDFLGAASKVAQRDGRLVEMYIFAALVYFLISFGLSQVVKLLQQKIAIIR